MTMIARSRAFVCTRDVGVRAGFAAGGAYLLRAAFEVYELSALRLHMPPVVRARVREPRVSGGRLTGPGVVQENENATYDFTQSEQPGRGSSVQPGVINTTTDYNTASRGAPEGSTTTVLGGLARPPKTC